MGALTVANITTRVQRQFGDSDLAQIAQADVINWINDAMREIAVANDLLQVKSTAATVANQAAYSLPVSPQPILKLRRVAYQGYALRPISLEESNELVVGSAGTVSSGLYPTGVPSMYWVYAGQINLYPAPSVAGASDLTLFWTRNPNPVALTTDTPELPAEYDNRIVEYCLQQAYELDTNVNLSNMKGSQFASGLQKLQGNADWENQDFYPNISTVAEYPLDTVGSWY